ncbi:hypothetical protein GCM10011399_12710 [Subtercola lobariae]|uniref:Transposase IS110-like N-terminal domain-containing protein n=1 Tax=Subtercola lobariae TaxID=1588641 RepID=A0A917B3C1_9MICO|nr:hypothetical protein GCM10011399_12710 [Subtercola lobariae]
MPKLWAGIDAGKHEHHCVVIDDAGKKLLSERVENDEATLLELIATAVDLAAGEQIICATDLNAGGAALLISLLADNGQQLLYIPGRIIHHASATYPGGWQNGCQRCCDHRRPSPHAPRLATRA